jgi:hypothetical protein
MAIVFYSDHHLVFAFRWQVKTKRWFLIHLPDRFFLISDAGKSHS